MKGDDYMDLQNRIERVKYRLKYEFGDKFSYVSGYSKYDEPCKFHCNICGSDFIDKPKMVLSNNKPYCPNCRISKSYNDDAESRLLNMIRKVEKKFNGAFEYMNGFTRMDERCTFHCKNCGNKQYILTPKNLLSKKSDDIYCNLCVPRQKSNSTNAGEKRFLENLNGDITVLGNYINNKTPVLVRHEFCNKEFYIKPNNLDASRSKTGKATKNQCKYCRMSMGEKYVYMYLDDLGIEYEIEKNFAGLKSESRSNLKYDFYIPSMNLLLEIDGKQHKKKSWGESEKELDMRMKREEIKNQFPPDNKMCLLRLRVFDGIVFGAKDFFENRYIISNSEVYGLEYLVDSDKYHGFANN